VIAKCSVPGMIRLALGLVTEASLLSVTGCSKSVDPNHLPTVAVRGVVNVDGKAVGPARMQLLADPGLKLPPVSGNVDKDGKFTLTTYQPDDGAPAGKYKVTLSSDVTNFAPIPEAQPLDVEISASDRNPTWKFVGTGKTAGSPLPPPP